MKKFFVNQWFNFKKNWYYYIFWLFLVPFFFLYIELGIYFIGCCSDSSLLFWGFNVCYYFNPCFYLGFAFICFFISFKINNLSLFIYSYYIYTGKNNWYRFYNERKKQHKKEDKIAYDEYLKSQKSE